MTEQSSKRNVICCEETLNGSVRLYDSENDDAWICSTETLLLSWQT